MATTVITGRDLALTIATVSYDAQASSVTLEADHVIETYQTLDGRAYKAIDDSWTLNVEMLADWALQDLSVKLFGQRQNLHQTRLWLYLLQLQPERSLLAMSCRHSQA